MKRPPRMQEILDSIHDPAELLELQGDSGERIDSETAEQLVEIDATITVVVVGE